jgi:branched-chain amino acid transport system ATP-binding protein
MDFGRVLAQGRPEVIRDDPKVIAAYLGAADEGGEPLPEPAEAKEAPVLPEEASGITVSHAVAHPLDDDGQAPLLEVRGLAAGYGPIEVIRDVSLFVKPGEVVACIGANGAGKTTTLRAISGVIRPRRGRVTLRGEDITHQRPEQIVRLGMIHIPQGRGLFPKLTVEDTMKLAAYSGETNDDFEPAFRVFPRLAERRRQLVGTLSGGEQQMVAMARALLVRPDLVMIDEMSQGLAPTVVAELFRLMNAFRERGIAVLLVEQFVDSALAIADRAYIFEQGTIVHEASAADLRKDKSLIAASYLGHQAEPEPKPAARGRKVAVGAAAGAANGNGNGHHNGNGNGNGHLPLELLETLAVRLPAELIRSIEERARAEGVATREVVARMLEGAKKK